MLIQIHPPRENAFADLERFINRITRPGNAEIRKVGDAVRQGFQRNFTNEGIGGMKWDRLAPETVEQRRMLGYGGEHPILVRTHAMQQSWVNAGNEDHVNEFERTADGWSLAVGSKHWKTKYHEDPPWRPVGELDRFSEGRLQSVLEFVINEAKKATIGR